MTGPLIPVIAIDGPSASGKGSVSRVLANHLGWHLLDSGVLYRLVGYAAADRGISLNDEAAISAMTRRLDIYFNHDADSQEGVVYLDGQRLGPELRTEDTGRLASRVARLPAVREVLLERQRAFHQPPGLVADGRDMGSVVFPQAALKVYLDASPDTRAKRRYNQLKEKGMDVNLSAVLSEILERDQRDSQRSAAPLAVHEGALLIDTRLLGVNEVVRTILEQWRLQTGDNDRLNDDNDRLS